jgi:Arc/MetJ family transcription regulator
MRTTIDIDDDVLQAAKERARRENRTIGQVVSDLARAALTSLPRSSKRGAQTRVCGFRPFPSRGGIVTNDLIDTLREDDAY